VPHVERVKQKSAARGTSSPGPAPEWTRSTHATDNSGVDWDAISQVLKQLRELTGKNKSQFASDYGGSKSSVTRIETATVRPDLESIERWVLA
jgi:hypothetical protein